MVPILFILFFSECNALGSLSSGASDFSIELVKHTGLNNVVIAPFSVWSLMASLSFWAEGELKDQMLDVLRLPMNNTVCLNEYSNLARATFDENSNNVNVSTKIFVFASSFCRLHPEFKETMVKYFRAVVETINFEYGEKAARRADNLIFKHIHSIFNIFQPKDFVKATMIMSSVLAFESKFKSEFNVSETIIEEHYHNNKTYLTQMMHQTLKLPYSNMPTLNSDVMELALGDDGKFCLLLIVPNSETNAKVVYDKLNAMTLKDIFDKLQSDVDKFGLKEVHLKLPKIRITTAINLNKPLSDIGLKHVLGPKKSEFIGIAREDLYISPIDHTCEMIIKEEGVFAFASTPGYSDYNTFGSVLEAEQPVIIFVMEKTTQTIILSAIFSRPVYILK